jgi:hypothetical protein
MFETIFSPSRFHFIERVAVFFLLQVDASASNPGLKNVWHEIEETFNDIFFCPKNALPHNEICGEDIINPQEPLFTGLESRSWEKLKSVWGDIRGDVTRSLANWNKRYVSVFRREFAMNKS